jgi:hypothetical protein
VRDFVFPMFRYSSWPLQFETNAMKELLNDQLVVLSVGGASLMAGPMFSVTKGGFSVDGRHRQ